MAEGSWIRLGATKVHLDAKTINPIITAALSKRAITVTQMPELRKQIGEAYLRAVTPFVPMKSGELRASGRATDDGRVYWTAVAPAWKSEDEGGYAFNYASYVYDLKELRWPESEGGIYKHPSTPDTFPRWIKKVQPDTPAWEAFVNNITPIIREAFAKNE